MKIRILFASLLLMWGDLFSQETLQTVTDRGNFTNTNIIFSSVNNLGLRWGFNGDLASMYYANHMNGFGKLILDIGDDNIPSQGFQIRGVRYDGPVNEIAYFQADGNVGIGTTSPQERLSVNGKIRAREIKVEATNWPDYVFDSGYKMPNLKEIEMYIQTHKHLPGFPSAKEVEANGVDLGELNKSLLKNQEELMLILIQQNKLLEKLSNRLNEQEAIIQGLKTSKSMLDEKK